MRGWTRSWRDFDTILKVNPHHIIPERPEYRYLFLYRNLKLIDEGVDVESLPLVETYRKVKKEGWRENTTPIKRARLIKEIYFSLKNEGYEWEPGSERDPIYVNVLKGGLITCHDGYNRLTMLHYLGAQEPIKVKVSLAPEIKKLLKITKKYYGSKGLYQPILHPVFDEMQVARPDNEERLKFLAYCLKPYIFRSILDIGSCTGYNTVMLAREFNCKATGIELDKTRFKIANGLLDWWVRYFGDIQFLRGDFQHLSVEQHDVTICLSVLHHYLKRSPDSVVEFVNRMEEVTNTVAIIEVATGEARQMRKIKPTPDKKYWLKLLQQTNFEDVTLLRTPPGTRYFFELRCGGRN